ncbi:MAG: CDP-diacylglycerol--glycerol-3-phosphate 3-phosphatidyltransferase [Ruminococcaceae bacterium]|nr:CDP-diacylglycerol--glycerol-3-phosphate 3-phosphatidyltransferase [Oscillospiraceae bacterium]
MNTPNKLTLFRILLIPLFMVVALYDVIPFKTVVSLAVFILACATDWLDGYLARKNNEVTNFGKIVDPLADKMLVTAALLCLVNDNLISPWIAIIILAREFIVSGIRISAASEGNVIAASMWGKVKTVWQFIAICITLVLADFAADFTFAKVIIDICMWTAAGLTIISGIDYVVKNIRYLSMK